MKKMLSLIALGAMLSFGASAQTATPAPTAKTPTAQQGKMATCNKDAAGKKGDDRKAFMKECLSAKPMSATPTGMTTQQEKMKTCNADAKTQSLKGEPRKAFMKTCLSKKA